MNIGLMASWINVANATIMTGYPSSVTFRHIAGGDQPQMAILSEPKGMIPGILESLRDLKALSARVVVDNADFARFESEGFSTAANGVVVVKNYSDLDVQQSAGRDSWHLFSESILGEP